MNLKPPPFSLLHLGWIIFGLGVIGDLVYHTFLLLTILSRPDRTLSITWYLIGALGHAVTFGGLVLIILALMRRHPR